jgi:hypothetical protein
MTCRWWLKLYPVRVAMRIRVENMLSPMCEFIVLFAFLLTTGIINNFRELAGNIPPTPTALDW